MTHVMPDGMWWKCHRSKVSSWGSERLLISTNFGNDMIEAINHRLPRVIGFGRGESHHRRMEYSA
jgi:hypothetical protein